MHPRIIPQISNELHGPHHHVLCLLSLALTFALCVADIYHFGFGFRFFLDYTVHTHDTRTLTPIWIHVRKLYPYEQLRKLSQQILEINEVTSLSTGTSPTTECTTPLNPRIFAPAGSRTQALRCYRGSCNHYATCPFAVLVLDWHSLLKNGPLVQTKIPIAVVATNIKSRSSDWRSNHHTRPNNYLLFRNN